MYYFFIVPEIFYVVVFVIIIAALWGGAIFISTFWATLLYYIFFILFIPILLISLLIYLDTDKAKMTKHFYSWICAFVMPFITMIIIKEIILDNYKYLSDTFFPTEQKNLLLLIGFTILLVLIFLLISKKNVFISIAIWALILLSSPLMKDVIVKQIAKNEIVTVISYKVKNTDYIYTATGYYENEKNTKNFNKLKIEVQKEDGSKLMIDGSKLKVNKYISHYDILLQSQDDPDLKQLLKSKEKK